MKCKFCNSNYVNKDGFTNSNTQRYRCKGCGKRYTIKNATDERVLSLHVGATRLRRNGLSYREIGKELGINHQTAANLQYDEPVVYIAKVGSFYKIGKTRNVSRRISELKRKFCGKRVELIHSGGSDHNIVERRIHELFNDKHVGNEFFVLTSRHVELAIAQINEW
jgi:hypothetical protein